MAAEQPRVVKCQHHGQFTAQPWKRLEVKIAAVKIVEMNDVGKFRSKRQKLPAPRKMKILEASMFVEPPPWFGQSTR